MSTTSSSVCTTRFKPVGEQRRLDPVGRRAEAVDIAVSPWHSSHGKCSYAQAAVVSGLRPPPAVIYSGRAVGRLLLLHHDALCVLLQSSANHRQSATRRLGGGLSHDGCLDGYPWRRS